MTPSINLLPQLPEPDELDQHGQGLFAAHRVVDLMLQAYARGAQSVDVSAALARLVELKPAMTTAITDAIKEPTP